MNETTSSTSEETEPRKRPGKKGAKAGIGPRRLSKRLERIEDAPSLGRKRTGLQRTAIDLLRQIASAEPGPQTQKMAKDFIEKFDSVREEAQKARRENAKA